MRSTIETRLDVTASSQAGHLTRRQLIDGGLGRTAVLRRTQSGLLVPVGRRTFRLGSVARSQFGDVVAACLDNEAIASHWTAACLHGLVAPRPLIDVTVRRAGSTREAVAEHPQQPRVRIHSSTNLPESDVVRHGAIPVTSVARTALGLAALVPRELSRRGLFDLVSQAVDLGLASDPWLWWLLTERRCRGRNGVIALETALAERTRLGPTESWLEREVIRILETAGIPLPVTQRVIRRRGRFAARVDFVYEQDLVVIEALGYAHHRSKAQLAADLERANRLQLLGYAVYQFTTEQIVATPSLLVSTVRAARENAHRRLAA